MTVTLTTTITSIVPLSFALSVVDDRSSTYSLGLEMPSNPPTVTPIGFQNQNPTYANTWIIGTDAGMTYRGDSSVAYWQATPDPYYRDADITAGVVFIAPTAIASAAPVRCCLDTSSAVRCSWSPPQGGVYTNLALLENFQLHIDSQAYSIADFGTAVYSPLPPSATGSAVTRTVTVTSV